MLATRGLPGIRIDVAPPPFAEAMPRMDVAVFVGFAATGPTHRAVAVESVAEYAAVFGPDAPLAWNVERSERVYANLGQAVRAFFSNGGRRCWVIRVARTSALEASRRGSDVSPPVAVAIANRFAVPGVLVVSGDGTGIAAAQAQARSVGAWSDPLRMMAALDVSNFLPEGWTYVLSAPSERRIRFSTRASLKPGDLIEFGDPASGSAIRGYAIVDRVVAVVAAGPSSQQVEATICAAFETLGIEASSPPLVSQGTAEIAGVTGGPVAATLEIDPHAAMVARLHFGGAALGSTAEGRWARWSDGGAPVWLRIDAFGQRTSAANPGQAEPVAEGPAWRELTPASVAIVAKSASLLTLDLRVLAEGDNAFRMTGVGLTPAHRLSWWQQVSDDVFYASPRATMGSSPAQQPPDRARQFPLAALDENLADVRPRAWIPLGVEPLYGAALAPVPQAASALERDGLARFEADLFLDPELASLRADALVEHADVVRFLRSKPRALFGMHAALSIGSGGLYNEASLIAIPDAVHTGWHPRSAVHPPPPDPLPIPTPAHWLLHRGPCAVAQDATITEPDFSRFLDCRTHALTAPAFTVQGQTLPRGAFLLTWTASEPGATYVLEETQRADFAAAREIHRGAALKYSVSLAREGIFYYRVYAVAGDERSADSVPVAIVVRDDAWAVNTRADFASDGEFQLLRIHRALLRLAAATGELFAVLSLPQHYRAPEAIRYASRLRADRYDHSSGGADPDGLDFNERRALSYGALYHPWAVSGAMPPPRSNDTVAATSSPARRTSPVPAQGGQRVCPPDGIATGVLAARALLRGAWVAPANEPFRDVVALTPPIETDAWLPLQDAQVNLVRADARGFLTLAADTLADQLEVRPINVRRLLILLRRMALRRGASYVFEPNGDTLRRSVERAFTVLLSDMFRRGAFSGATAPESFQVVTGGGINTDRDRDAGRFLVELRVAPSLPLQFLTLRLAQSGERLTVAEEL